MISVCAELTLISPGHVIQRWAKDSRHRLTGKKSYELYSGCF